MAKLGAQFSTAPSDSVSSLVCSAHADVCAVASWDSTLRVYDLDRLSELACIAHPAPLLSCTFAESSPSILYTTNILGHVTSTNLDQPTPIRLGSHSSGATGIASISPTLLVTSGWDGQLKLWDIRSRDASPLRSFGLPGKALALSISLPHHRGVVATTNQSFAFFDLAALVSGQSASPFTIRDSPLKHPLCSAQMLGDGTAVALGGVEGKIAIEYIDNDAASQRYAFKAHRRASPHDANVEMAYPIQALGVHPTLGTLASGGGDGVATWDWRAMKRLGAVSGYEPSVAALAFSRDGSKMVVAACKSWELGVEASEGVGKENNGGGGDVAREERDGERSATTQGVNCCNESFIDITVHHDHVPSRSASCRRNKDRRVLTLAT